MQCWCVPLRSTHPPICAEGILSWRLSTRLRRTCFRFRLMCRTRSTVQPFFDAGESVSVGCVERSRTHRGGQCWCVPLRSTHPPICAKGILSWRLSTRLLRTCFRFRLMCGTHGRNSRCIGKARLIDPHSLGHFVGSRFDADDADHTHGRFQSQVRSRPMSVLTWLLTRQRVVAGGLMNV